jgi:hypothetical protein
MLQNMLLENQRLCSTIRYLFVLRNVVLYRDTHLEHGYLERVAKRNLSIHSWVSFVAAIVGQHHCSIAGLPSATPAARYWIDGHPDRHFCQVVYSTQCVVGIVRHYGAMRDKRPRVL